MWAHWNTSLRKLIIGFILIDDPVQTMDDIVSLVYQNTTLEKKHSRNLKMIATDEDKLEAVRCDIDAAVDAYAMFCQGVRMM